MRNRYKSFEKHTGNRKKNPSPSEESMKGKKSTQIVCMPKENKQ